MMSFRIFAIIFVILVIPTAGFCKDVSLAWDYDNPSQVDGYRLYAGESGQPLAKLWEGSALTTTLDLQEGKTYQFSVTAYKGDLESDRSDILQYTVSSDQQTIVIPPKPKSIRIIFE